MSKFKVGDRVRIIGHGCALRNTEATITSVEDGGWVDFETDDGRSCRDHNVGPGEHHELQLVTSKENKPMETKQRRTFKLVKAMPGIKVGTLFQEECEDGTQPYSPMESISGVTVRFSDRSLVEDSPFFKEVFKVEPEYMTQDELDKWKAFNGQKKRGRPVGSTKKRKYVKSGKYAKKATK